MSRFQKAALVAGAVLTMAMPIAVHAQDTDTTEATTFSIESIGSQIGLGDSDLKKTVLNILNLVLGLLTLVAVVMIIVGGFTWLTAGGNEEKTDTARKIISAAVIGLIIVLLAWAVVIFVARTTANVTTNGTDSGS